MFTEGKTPKINSIKAGPQGTSTKIPTCVALRWQVAIIILILQIKLTLLMRDVGGIQVLVNLIPASMLFPLYNPDMDELERNVVP